MKNSTLKTTQNNLTPEYERLLMWASDLKAEPDLFIKESRISSLLDEVIPNKEDIQHFRFFFKNLAEIQRTKPDCFEQSFYSTFWLKRTKPFFPFVPVYSMNVNYFKENPKMEVIFEEWFEYNGDYKRMLHGHRDLTALLKHFDKYFAKWARKVTPEHPKRILMKQKMKRFVERFTF